MDPIDRPRSTRGGFTMLEVMFALGILAFGLLTLALMQISALSQGSSARDLSAAAVLARDQMERVQSLPWAQVAPTNWVAPAWINFAGQAAGDVPVQMRVSSQASPLVTQVYTVRWRVTAVAGSTNLRNVDVQVQWNEPHRPNRTLTISGVRYDG